MTVALLNMYSTRNLGDAAIYAAIADMVPGGRVSGALVEHHPTRINGLRHAADIESCDAYVSVGGDIFNNARPRLVTRRFLQNVSALRRSPASTMLFGQSIPRSCRNLALRYLSSSLKNLPHVAVRDVESHDKLTRLGVAAHLTFDTAFALPPQTSARSQALQLYAEAGLKPEKTALVSLRNQSSLYASNGGERQILQIAQALAARGHQIGLLIQADGDDADTDWKLARSIQAAVPSARVLNPFEVAGNDEPWAVASAVLGLANVVVAVRYHAAVLRMVEGRQPFVLHYSNKGEDLCSRLGQPGNALGDGEIASLVQRVESTAGKSFDNTSTRRHVRDTFAAGLGKILS
jgi:polysaccharide pyruvyl transferase WcaK-like protein